MQPFPRLRFLVLVCLIGLFTPTAKGAVTLLDQNSWKVLLGGFAELDLVNDSTRSLVESTGNALVDRPGTANGDNGRSAFSVRNSRLAVTVLAPAVEDWQTKFYFEGDFLGYDPAPGSAAGNSEASFFTSPSFRVRHFYLSAENGGWQILAGQYWTLFGWQPIYNPTTVSVPPVAGTLYERTPQVTFLRTMKLGETNTLYGGVSIIRPPQRDAQLPGLDAGLRLAMGSRLAPYTTYTGDLKTDPMSVAVSGTVRDFAVPVAGSTTAKTQYAGYGVAADLFVPIIASSDAKDTSGTLAFMGEFSLGTGFADQFTSWTGNLKQLLTANSATQPNLDAGQGGFDAAGQFRLLNLRSFHLSAQYHFPQGWDSFATLGYAQLFSDNVAGMTPAAGTIYDRSETAFLNFFHDFTARVRMGAEYAYFQTEYVDGVYARCHRVQVSGYFRL